MKRFIQLAIIMSILFGTAFAQKNDTTRIKIGKKRIIVIDENDEISEIISDTSLSGVHEDEYDIDVEDDDDGFDSHWGGLDLGINNFMNSSYSTSLSKESKFLELNTSKSWGVSLNVFEHDFPLYQDKIALVTGLGFEFNNYRFDNKNILIGDQDTITFFLDTVSNYAKNKLTSAYLTIPLLLEGQIPVGSEGKRLYISAGLSGGIKLGSHTKQVQIVDGQKDKQKTYDDFHLSVFRYGLTARLGYEDIGVFLNYNLSTLFEAKEGPELYPFTAGISINI